MSEAKWLTIVYVVAMVIQQAADKFDGHGDFNQALKVAAYSPTAAWIAGVFSLLPPLSVLGQIGRAHV